MSSVKIDDEMESVLEDKGLKEDEIEKIVEDAGSGGERLKSSEGDRFLAKDASENLTIYVLYESSGEEKVLKSVYTHKMAIEGLTEEGEGEKTVNEDWICGKCGEDVVEQNVDLTYLGVTRPAPGLVCPECEDAYITEEMATNTLKTAEATLEEKRA